MKTDYHIPVLREACVEALALRQGGVYVDATFGGGGHSRLILEKLRGGRLIAFDRDVDAQRNMPEDPRFTLVHHDYTHLRNYLRHLEAIPVDGILADLGISSHQVDEAERGFSFRFDAPLDMRMDRQSELTAEMLINRESAASLQKIFSMYGEIKNARTLAQAIVTRRQVSPIRTTGQLAEAAEQVLPHRENIRKYLAPVFQALRIAVNDELAGLQSFLEQCLDVLKPGGRLVVLTYHSLEDRIVKNFLQQESAQPHAENMIYGGHPTAWKELTRKPVVPDEAEILANPRARSAKLRIAEKLQTP